MPKTTWGRNEKAFFLFSIFGLIFPSFFSFLKRSQAHLKAGNLQKALKDLDELLQLKPTHTKSVLKRAEILVQVELFAC
jgi:hypothetical protein